MAQKGKRKTAEAAFFVTGSEHGEPSPVHSARTGRICEPDLSGHRCLQKENIQSGREENLVHSPMAEHRRRSRQRKLFTNLAGCPDRQAGSAVISLF